MKKIGIIICVRDKDCGGGKCFRALRERRGAFSIYPAIDPVEIVGYPPCQSILQFKTFIEAAYGLPVVVGTHPTPQKYMDVHVRQPTRTPAGLTDEF